jgi:hypothetical protein
MVKQWVGIPLSGEFNIMMDKLYFRLPRMNQSVIVGFGWFLISFSEGP